MIGTGPFVLTSYKPSLGFSFKRNPEYWEKDDALAEQVDMPIVPGWRVAQDFLPPAFPDVPAEFTQPAQVGNLDEQQHEREAGERLADLMPRRRGDAGQCQHDR